MNHNNTLPTTLKNDKKLLQNIENHYGKMWRNKVPPAKYGSLLYTIFFITKIIYGEKTEEDKH